MSDQSARIRMLREAGHVRRCHTTHVIGDHYNVAYHSWNAAVLLMMLHPDPSPDLIKAVLLHDVGERFVGDLPAPMKWEFPAVKNEHGYVEKCIMNEMIGVILQLTDEDEEWLSSVDALEFFLYCADQLAMGNTHIAHAMTNITKHIRDRAVTPVKKFVETFKWSRTNDRFSDAVQELLQANLVESR